jgi:putative peptidoglycan lipid II flippase
MAEIPCGTLAGVNRTHGPGSVSRSTEQQATATAGGPSKRLARSAGLIGLATMTSRILGLVREQVLAFLFGAGNEMDAFNVAFRIPNLFRDLFAEGALSAAFVPAFTRRLTLGGRNQAWRLGNYVVNALLAITLALVVLGVVFARPLVMLFASDYAVVPGKIDLTVDLARVIFPFLTLVALAAACMGMLNSLQRFFLPALSPVMFNVATIACAVALVPAMPLLHLPRIMAIAIGALIGGVGQVALQWPALGREGFRYRPALDLRDEGLHQVLVLMGPGLVGLAAVQINLFVNTVLATGQGTGAVSWLNYAFRLMYMPIGLFGVSIATAALPVLSRQAAQGEVAGMRQTVSSGLRMMLMLNVPATAGLIALAWPIIALLFQHGSFTRADTSATAIALACYAPGLVGYSAVRLAVPAFYALHDSRTPVVVSVATMLLNAALNIALVRVVGYPGLALGTAVASLFNAALLLWLLRAPLDGLDGRRIATSLVKILVASVVMGLVAWQANAVLTIMVAGETLVARLIRVSSDIALALVVLVVAARALRISEFTEALLTVRRRIFGAEQE